MKKLLYKLSFIKHLPSDFILLCLTIVGKIPIHFIRKFFYKMFGIKIGKQTSFHWRARFFHPSGIKIGNNTCIGSDSFLDGRRKIFIGDNVNLSSEVSIWTEQHDYNDPNFSTIGGMVKIEDYVWISHRAIILPNVTIGKGAVVAAGAVVSKDVKPYEVVGGIPAKFIAKRNKDLRYNLDYHKSFQ